MENRKSRPTILVDTEDKLEAFFNKDEIRFIEDIVDDALGFRDDYENIVDVSVYSSNIANDRVRIIIEQHISSISTIHAPSDRVCGYSIPATEKLFKSIDRDFIFSIEPKLLVIERKEN